MSQRPALGCLFEVVETLVLTVVIFLGIQTFVAQPYKVQQESMETTLLPDQYVLVDKLSPRWAAYGYGDIVVFDPPESWSAGSGVPFIKRIIGLPGETVRIGDDGIMYVNGQALDETGYTYRDDAGDNEPTTIQTDQAEWTLAPDEVFVMGDHREASADSRSFGPVKLDHIIGRAFLRYWPAATVGVLSRPTYQSPQE